MNVLQVVPKEARLVLAIMPVRVFYICGVQEELTVTGWVNFIGTMAGECFALGRSGWLGRRM